MAISTILLVTIVVLVLYIFGFYNRLKTLLVRIEASIQEIGNQLKRQASLIPDLVESTKSFLKHEKDIFTQWTNARKAIDTAVASSDPKQIEMSQDLVSKALSSLRVIVERSPELSSQGTVTKLMDELRDTADKLMYARRTLIDLSADYNTSIVTIPGVWLASLLGFKKQTGLATPTSGEHIQVSSEELKKPTVKLD